LSSVYRFQDRATIVLTATLNRLRKRKPRKFAEPILIAADSSSVTDSTGTWSMDEYRIIPKSRYVTLTRREADFIAIANPGARPPLALEIIHPWLPQRPFVSDSQANFRSLKTLYNLYGHHFIIAASFCDAKWNTICHAIRMKSDLDHRFFTAWHLPIQDVFVLEERRPERSVISIDFNAMYSACMQQKFPKPAAMRQVNYDRDVKAGECLPIGLYRCLISSPNSEFIRKHNPFRSFFSGKQLQASLAQAIEVDLNEFEIDFFHRHFKKIYVIDAVISNTSIVHPLAREVRRSFAKRKHYRSQGNKPLADREKYLSTLMSSCSHRPIKSRTNFNSRDAMSEYLSTNYGINPHVEEPDCASEHWMRGRKGIVVSETPDGFSVDGPDVLDGNACFLLNQRIVARARIVLLAKMEEIFCTVPDVEICYVNIDSIHFSLPTIDLADTVKALQADASDEMGSFKIEVVARHGLWLEPGRYWLYSDKVQKFKNRGIGNRLKPFIDHAIYLTSRKLGELHIPIRMTIQMDKTMSDSRSIIEDPLSSISRQVFVEIGGDTAFSDILQQLELNGMGGTLKRMQAFKNLEVLIARNSSCCFRKS